MLVLRYFNRESDIVPNGSDEKLFFLQVTSSLSPPLTFDLSFLYSVCIRYFIVVKLFRVVLNSVYPRFDDICFKETSGLKQWSDQNRGMVAQQS